MRVLVSDTSVLVDLERGQVLDACFALPFEFAVPDLLYNKELAAYGGEKLIAKGLRIEALGPAEVAQAQAVRASRPKLSLPDSFAFALAAERGWSLLSGDSELRALAAERQLLVHGVLWVFDRLFEAKVKGGGDLAVCLEGLANHPRCRLPKPEITSRLVQYRKS